MGYGPHLESGRNTQFIKNLSSSPSEKLQETLKNSTNQNITYPKQSKLGDLEGIKLVINKGFNKIEIQSDNKMVIEKINGKKVFIGATTGLRNQIRQLTTGDTLVKFVHVFREVNRCTDALTKRSFQHDHGPQVFED